MAFPLFLEIVYLPIVDLPVRILDLAIAYHFVFIPFSRNYFARWKDERAFSVEFVAEAVSDIFIAIEELEVPFDFDAVLIYASELSTIYLKVTPLW